MSSCGANWKVFSHDGRIRKHCLDLQLHLGKDYGHQMYVAEASRNSDHVSLMLISETKFSVKLFFHRYFLEIFQNTFKWLPLLRKLSEKLFSVYCYIYSSWKCKICSNWMKSWMITIKILYGVDVPLNQPALNPRTHPFHWVG